LADLKSILLFLTIAALPVVLAVTLHEAAHGYVANRLGDDTAKRQGRLSLNPLVHVDPFGTVILPGLLLLLQSGILFGYAKPVPVRFDRLKNPRQDMIWVAAAGPATNFLLAFVSTVLLALFAWAGGGGFAQWAGNMLSFSIFFNILIGVFNLMPVPPLDGGRIVTGLLPTRLAIPYARTERFGFLIVLGAFLVLPMLTGFSLFQPLILAPTQAMSDFFHALVGLQRP